MRILPMLGITMLCAAACVAEVDEREDADELELAVQSEALEGEPAAAPLGDEDTISADESGEPGESGDRAELTDDNAENAAKKKKELPPGCPPPSDPPPAPPPTPGDKGM
jgi:hypothetical protein